MSLPILQKKMTGLDCVGPIFVSISALRREVGTLSGAVHNFIYTGCCLEYVSLLSITIYLCTDLLTYISFRMFIASSLSYMCHESSVVPASVLY